MNEQTIHERAKAFCAALLAGDVGRAAEQMSSQLRSNLGPVVAMLPMPLTEATVESVQATGTGYAAILNLVGESTSTRLQVRWKDRDGTPTIVEASHLPQEPMELPETDLEPPGES